MVAAIQRSYELGAEPIVGMSLPDSNVKDLTNGMVATINGVAVDSMSERHAPKVECGLKRKLRVTRQDVALPHKKLKETLVRIPEGHKREASGVLEEEPPAKKMEFVAKLDQAIKKTEELLSDDTITFSLRAYFVRGNDALLEQAKAFSDEESLASKVSQLKEAQQKLQNKPACSQARTEADSPPSYRARASVVKESRSMTMSDLIRNQEESQKQEERVVVRQQAPAQQERGRAALVKQIVFRILPLAAAKYALEDATTIVTKVMSRNSIHRMVGATLNGLSYVSLPTSLAGTAFLAYYDRKEISSWNPCQITLAIASGVVMYSRGWGYLVPAITAWAVGKYAYRVLTKVHSLVAPLICPVTRHAENSNEALAELLYSLP